MLFRINLPSLAINIDISHYPILSIAIDFLDRILLSVTISCEQVNNSAEENGVGKLEKLDHQKYSISTIQPRVFQLATLQLYLNAADITFALAPILRLPLVDWLWPTLLLCFTIPVIRFRKNSFCFAGKALGFFEFIWMIVVMWSKIFES